MKKIIIEVENSIEWKINISEELMSKITSMILEENDTCWTSYEIIDMDSELLKYEHYIWNNKYTRENNRIRDYNYDYLVIYSPCYWIGYNWDRLNADKILEILYIKNFFEISWIDEYDLKYKDLNHIFDKITKKQKLNNEFIKTCNILWLSSNENTLQYFIKTFLELDVFPSENEYGFKISDYDGYEAYTLIW